MDYRYNYIINEISLNQITVFIQIYLKNVNRYFCNLQQLLSVIETLGSPTWNAEKLRKALKNSTVAVLKQRNFV